VTLPRQVVPGRSYLLSRRCNQRQFLLRPDDEVERIYLYCLAEAVSRYGISLHGYIAMSNHHHLVVRDNLGNGPRFYAHLNKMVAKAMNRYLGRWENFWATGQASTVRLVEPRDELDKLVYLLANPVAAHLVERVAEWPGACSFTQHLTEEPRLIRRPGSYFRTHGPMPAEVTLTIERVRGFEILSHEEWVGLIRARVLAEETRAHDERVSENLRVLGREAVLAVARTDAPASVKPRRRLSPEIACRDEEQRAAALAVERL
jgi:hypothetical protein